MPDHFDAIILGQGLAGTTLAWILGWQGDRVLVIDRDQQTTSSKVAAGLVTPISGQKLTATWKFAESWEFAARFYRRVEQQTSSQFFRQTSMIRLFQSPQEKLVFATKRESGEFQSVSVADLPPLSTEAFNVTMGGFEMAPGGQLDVRQFLATSQNHFRKQNGYLSCEIDVSREIELSSECVKLPRLGVSATSLIFCQGMDTVSNPWFQEVQFKPAKGEILTLRIHGLSEQRVIHQGVWLAPIGDDLYRAGSTYCWNDLDCQPTSDARTEIIEKLGRFLRLPIEVVAQEAAIRPIHRNQYPVLGRHPDFPQLGFFNGLGSKGVLHAPYFADQLASHLRHGHVVDPEVDLHRKANWRGSGQIAQPSRASGNTAPCHVKRPIRRPLTEQAQIAVGNVIRSGDWVIDATAGNGYDAHFLAMTVGGRGVVFAFDIQHEALENTARRLESDCLTNVVLINGDHSEMVALIPHENRGQIAAVMFNLGYLPGGNHDCTTKPDSTRSALLASFELLKPGGIVTIVAYTGHDGGLSETRIVEEVLGTLPGDQYAIEIFESQPGKNSGPRLFIVTRSKLADDVNPCAIPHH